MTNRTILHITGDYPDDFQERKTPVIRRLINALDNDYDHLIVSINRVSSPQRTKFIRNGNLLSVQYFAPPKGILQKYFVDYLSDELACVIGPEITRDALVFAHKFALEGMIAHRLANLLSVPYSIGFMGNSDRAMFSVKPHYRNRYRKVVQGAQHLVFSTPWAFDYFDKRLLRPAGVDPASCHIVPYISNDTIAPPAVSQYTPGCFLTVFNFQAWKFKNIARLIRAIAAVNLSGKRATLDIAGWGKPEEVSRVRDIVSRNGGDAFVSYLGHLSSGELDQLGAKYAAMVLPSYPESFGLVYIEALSRGMPIMCSRNAGFDGFFKDTFPGVIVDHRSVLDIANGIIHMMQQGRALRGNIQKLQPQMKLFEKDGIIKAYSRIFSEDSSASVPHPLPDRWLAKPLEQFSPGQLQGCAERPS